MSRLTLYKIAFFLSVVTGIIGFAAKIMHIPGGHILILFGLLFSLVFVIIALYEIFKSDKITLDEKIMWTIGFIVVFTVTGLLYLIMGRQRIVREFKILNHQQE
ncbi:hypothetical protein [Daejeonella sp.]|uniref:hypothetical protein n=1 Tax=Daejeonella sp. TaxID=2805397 RepID=UPI00398398C3